MQKPEERRTFRRLMGLTLAAAAILVWGALTCIAPVWQASSPVVPYLPAGQTNAAQTVPVDINTATEEELMLLPEIGPARAAAIVAYRAEHGAFTSIRELDRVDGISARMIDLWDGLAVAGTPAASGLNTD